MKDIRWFFPSTQNTGHEGFLDAGIQHFEGDHANFIARESIQNSLDARRDATKPVIVEFKLLYLPLEKFPGFEAYQHILEQCYAYSKRRADQRPITFFKRATELKGKISVLSISDTNTKGLEGTDKEEDEDKTWFLCTKMKGSSTMRGPGGGTYGIGKHAPFAASGMRAVFYSTINPKGEPAFIGKAILSSFRDDDGDVRCATGYYGSGGTVGIRDEKSIPEFFQRKEQGLTLFVMDYECTSDWRVRLLPSILNNYFAAINNGDLEVRLVDGASSIVVNKNNLSEHLKKLRGDDTITVEFYEALTRGKVFKATLDSVGEVQLFVAVQDGYSKNVAYMRRPRMMVEAKPKWVLREDFAAVFLCEDKRGNTELAKLEGPTHNAWEHARYPVQGKIIDDEVNNWIRDCLRSMNQEDESEESEISELNKYLPMEEDEGRKRKGAAGEPAFEEETPAESAKKVIEWSEMLDSRPRARSKRVVIEDGEPKPPKPPNGSSGHFDLKFRWVPDIKNASLGTLILYPEIDSNCALRIVARGEDADYPIAVLNSTDEASGQRVDLSDYELEAGKSRRIHLTLGSAGLVALGVEAHEI